MQTKCPGQDTRYWNPGDVFEVECGECGYEVEFFKDDAQRRCPKCGTRVSNPKLNLGCAQWCEHAKECLGYDPKERAEEAGAGQDALTDRLVAALKRELGEDKDAFGRAVEVFNQAHQLLSREGGNPKVALSAALLLHLDPDPKEPVRSVELMKEAGMDRYSMKEAARLIAAFGSGEDDQTPEYLILTDADRLAGLEQNRGKEVADPGLEDIDSLFKTASGRAAATAFLSGGAGA